MLVSTRIVYSSPVPADFQRNNFKRKLHRKANLTAHMQTMSIDYKTPLTFPRVTPPPTRPRPRRLRRCGSKVPSELSLNLNGGWGCFSVFNAVE